ncbi:CheY-like superfamily [Penicillium nucicola]|uniref:CheY-like superfamily n=1 Tax=Penicillium nucicola TaxID=1850975 RepID=UPI0025452821|nr:CheY-like superfamily [Penicillium nucicola]KAJ5770874.1 CheY-like superfamily [Penicillium nucicola]
MTSQNSSGSGPEKSQYSQTSLDNSNQTLSNSHRTESTSQNDGRVSSTGLSGSDRIYPVRSLVSMKPVGQKNISPFSSLENVEEFSNHPEEPPISTIDALPEARNPYSNQVFHPMSHTGVSVNDEISSNTPATGDMGDIANPFNLLDTAPKEVSEENQTYTTSRFEHTLTENGHTVMIGDSRKTLKRCEDEPIRTPGAIQSFGAMVALREESPNQLVVRAVSENSERIMGYSPQNLFAIESFTDILREDQRATLLEHLDYVRDDSYDLVIDGPEVFLLAVQTPLGGFTRFWCATHVSQENKDIIICEFEPEDDQINPLNVEDQKLPETPTSTLKTHPPPSEQQYAESTISASNSVRSIRDARRRKGEAASMQVFGTLSQIQAQLSQVKDLETLLKVTAGLVKELVGFHRVLVYQFDHKANGRVVAELMDPNVTVDLFQGLHFPASDIPAQARELYKVNKVRLLYNRDHVSARLVCRTLADLETPLDMSHAYLRAMSPIHSRYLANMEVRSSMSISINAYDNLWGLISCHSYGEDGMRVSFPIRKLCRLVGDTVARNIERITHASDLQARVMVNSVPKEADPSKYIVGSSDDLLRLFQADYGVLSIGNEAKLFGSDANSQEVLALLQYIRIRKVTSVLASHDIGKDFSDFVYRPGLKRISGLLCIPMSSDGADFIAFFRLGQLTTIKWAGNPHKPADGGIGPLTPRQSFKEWREITLSESKQWAKSDISTAGILGSVYGKFIQVWRQKEVLKQNSQLTRLLLANSAHEVRTPLNAVINYLEIAMEATLDDETRENLTRSYSASKSLVYIVNDLLDLATESGQQLIKNEAFDLKTTLCDAFDMLTGEAERKGISFTFKMRPGLPDAVLGDQRRLRQIFVNLISNAIEHTVKGGVSVEVSPSGVQDEHASLEMTVVDTGPGISKSRRERLFKELEEVHTDEHWFTDGLNAAEHSGGEQRRVLGVGLALTARIVYTMNGQLHVKSEEGKGSRFRIILPFAIPGKPSSLSSEKLSNSNFLDLPKSPSILDGEFTSLVGDDKAQNQSVQHDSNTNLTGDYLGHGKGQSDQLESSQPQNNFSNSESRMNQNQPMPLRLPIRLSYDKLKPQDMSEISPQQQLAKENFQGGSKISKANPSSPSSSSNASMNILIAEDNPVNSHILQKRLTRIGHTVQLTNNGEACVNALSSKNETFSAILMDIQMPIIDGITATKIIRATESDNSNSSVSDASNRSNRIPIFAVSASLAEKDEQAYIDAGFDGWVMKPIDFARLNIILAGIHDLEVRQSSTEARDWEKGGWFDTD